MPTTTEQCDLAHSFWSLTGALVYCSFVARTLLTVSCSRAASPWPWGRLPGPITDIFAES